MIIRNIEEFAAEVFGTTPDHLERDVYKYTDCGAWINWDDKEIRIGSIVEGSEAEFSCDPLVFPFDSKEAEKELNWLDEVTTVEWHRVNPQRDDIISFLETELFAYEEKPTALYSLEDASTDLEEQRKVFEESDFIDLYHVDPEDYMEAVNYCITNVWHSLKKGENHNENSVQNFCPEILHRFF